ARTVDGAAFDSAELAGRPAVLWFWTPWCPTCRGEAPEVARAAREHAGAVTFVGVAGHDRAEAMRAFVADHELEFTNLDDADGAVWRLFGVTHQPAYAFVAADGAVEVVRGTLGHQQLTERLGALTAAATAPGTAGG
ncbi:MAG TPA: redoxin domain-containing protein, partial [Pseudonocardiaceae bacterium]